MAEMEIAEKIANDALFLYALEVDLSNRRREFFIDAVKTAVEGNAIKCEVPKCRKIATHHLCPEHNLKRAERLVHLGEVQEQLKTKKRHKCDYDFDGGPCKKCGKTFIESNEVMK